jgi:hypothetical protein
MRYRRGPLYGMISGQCLAPGFDRNSIRVAKPGNAAPAGSEGKDQCRNESPILPVSFPSRHHETVEVRYSPSDQKSMASRSSSWIKIPRTGSHPVSWENEIRGRHI